MCMYVCGECVCMCVCTCVTNVCVCVLTSVHVRLCVVVEWEGTTDTGRKVRDERYGLCHLSGAVSSWRW